ncbi:MAG: metal-sensing transcriptional repressor [Proteobacteria bacterium]|nr:metal-sensing transcriptional repressor [Pseudomonadota bacterium]
MTPHTSHPDIIKRLKRAEGHLRSIIDMLEQDRGCLDIAQQLQAVEKAISSAKKTLVHDHINHCLNQAVQTDTKSATDAIEEFKEITKYL